MRSIIDPDCSWLVSELDNTGMECIVIKNAFKYVRTVDYAVKK
jgi:hypothetical protein